MSNSIGRGSIEYASNELKVIPKGETIIGMRKAADIYNRIKQAERVAQENKQKENVKEELDASSLVGDIQKAMDGDRAR